MNNEYFYKSICEYLGYEPSPLLYEQTLGADGNIFISKWELPEAQPTAQQLEQLLPLVLEKSFKDNFIILSIGAYRKAPHGYSSAVESFNVLCNIAIANNGLPQEIAQEVKFYQVPNFFDATQCSDEWLIQHQISLNQMTLQDFMQLYTEFNAKWLIEQHR